MPEDYVVEWRPNPQRERHMANQAAQAEDLTAPELHEIAAEAGLDLPKRTTKAGVRQALEDAARDGPAAEPVKEG